MRALAVTGNTIYAGGTFTTVGGQAHGHIARLDSSGTVDPWAPSFNWPVLALAVGGTGNLYVGGEFNSMNGTIRNRLAAFAANGQLLGWAPNADHYVHALAVSPDVGAGETVYIGGQFGAINGQVRRRIAQVDSDFGSPTAWNPWGYETVNQQEVVHALVYSNGTVYAGGLFSRLGANLAQITAGGVLTPMGANSRVWTLALSGSTLYVGGEFGQVYNGSGWVARNRVAAIATATRTVTSFDPDIGDREVYSIATDSGSVHVGGSFTQVGGQVVSGFATVNKSNRQGARPADGIVSGPRSGLSGPLPRSDRRCQMTDFTATARSESTARADTQAEEQAIRERVRDLTAQMLSSGRLDTEGVKDVVRAMSGGAARPPLDSAQARETLAESLRVLDQALQLSAQATHEALQTLVTRGKDFSDNDHKNTFATLQKLQQDYVAIATRLADALRQQSERSKAK